MARPRKPTAILALAGAFRKDPKRGRARAHEAQPVEEIGEPPAFLTAEQRAVWRQIVEDCAHGVLTRADRLAVETAAMLIAQQRTPDGLTAAERTNLTKLMGEMGLTPRARAYVKTRPEGEMFNPFAAA